MKKMLSILLSVIMLVSTLSISFNSYAAGWADKAQYIYFGETYVDSCDYTDFKAVDYNYEYFDACEFTVPFTGTITVKVECQDHGYIWNKFSIYSVNNVNKEIMQFDCAPYNYSSGRDVYYGEESIKLSPGSYYLVINYKSKPSDYFGTHNTTLYYKPNISTPSTLKVSTRNTTSLKLAWNKIGGVSGYQLQRKSGDSWKTVANTTATSYTVKSLKVGTTYNFRVRAYKTIKGTKYYSGWRTLKTPTSPSKPGIKTPSTNKKHQITAKWKKVSACSGYQVQFSTNSKFKKATTKTVSGTSKTSCTGKFKKGKKYYIRVRSYKMVDGKKYYSAWSSVKSIKCK